MRKNKTPADLFSENFLVTLCFSSVLALIIVVNEDHLISR